MLKRWLFPLRGTLGEQMDDRRSPSLLKSMVKRTLLLAAASLLIAGGALAWVPFFLSIRWLSGVANRAGCPVKAVRSGLDPTWTQYRWEFFSADESIAIVEGLLQSPAPDGTIIVTGIERRPNHALYAKVAGYIEFQDKGEWGRFVAIRPATE